MPFDLSASMMNHELVHGGNALALFHGVVVMGAALGAGCGVSGLDDATASAGSAGAGGTGGYAGTGSAAGTAQGGQSGKLNGGGTSGIVIVAPCTEPGLDCNLEGGGTMEAPLGPSDCATPQQFRFAGTQNTCGGEPARYECDATAPLVPTDCEQTYQFHCVDWRLSCGCHCDPMAPGDVSACTSPGTKPMLVCYSYDPPVGCLCNYIAPSIL